MGAGQWFDPDDGLYIAREAVEAAELGIEKIAASDLARRVLRYWGKRIGYGDIETSLPHASNAFLPL